MTERDCLFDQLLSELPDTIEGTMFGARSIETTGGTVAAFAWQGNLVVKLPEPVRERALELDGATIASHMYAPERQLSGWVSIPEEHAEYWTEFTEEALEYVTEGK